MVNEIKLPSGRVIGDNHPAFIIAEVGSNWETFQDCMDSIVAAKQAGADAVKFQLFDHKSLYGLEQEAVMLVPGKPVKNKSSFGDRLKFNPLSRVVPVKITMAGQLPIEWLPKLKEKADACKIEFMCTAFSPELYDVVDPFVSIHKVASAEMTHVRILEKLRSFGKPVILSTGASGRADIVAALEVLQQEFTEFKVENPKETWFLIDERKLNFPAPGPVILLYCTAAYPAQNVNPAQIKTLRNLFNVLTGFSDHTLDVSFIPSKACQEYGAVVIEKHFKIREMGTPDCPHSLNAEQFKTMVHAIREGLPNDVGPTKEEQAMILRHNRRLIAIRDINPGDRLIENENFGIYRSLKDDTKALHPFYVSKVHNSIARNAIKAGDGIGPSDVA